MTRRLILSIALGAAELARESTHAASPTGETMACGLGYEPHVCIICGSATCGCDAEKVRPAPGDGYCYAPRVEPAVNAKGGRS